MARIGNLGGTVFAVRRGHVLTFDGLSVAAESRVASHDIIGERPRLEFLAPGGRVATLNIQLNKALGVSPSRELERLEKMRDTGEVVPLIIGGRPVGARHYVVTGVDAGYVTVNGYGRPVRIDAKITLKEYTQGGGR